MQFEASFIKGEALRRLDRYREAIAPLEIAASLRPGDSRVALALGWCYKRTNRLAQAIDALERARRHMPTNAAAALQSGLLLEPGGQPARASTSCTSALDLEAGAPTRIAEEPDFSTPRQLRTFERLLRSIRPASELAERPDIRTRLATPGGERIPSTWRDRDRRADQISSSTRWVISFSQTLHHFQRLARRLVEMLVAIRTLRNQILVSASPTFSSFAHGRSGADWMPPEG